MFKSFWELLGLFSVAVTGMVALLRYLATKWIDAQFKAKEDESVRRHQERMAEIDNQYKLLQQRENVKYAKMFEARWEALEVLPHHLRALESHVTHAGIFLTIGMPAFNKNAREIALRIPEDCERLSTFIDKHGTYFGENFIRNCRNAVAEGWAIYTAIRENTEDLSTAKKDDNIRELEQRLLEAIKVVEKDIRNHLGSETV